MQSAMSRLLAIPYFVPLLIKEVNILLGKFKELSLVCLDWFKVFGSCLNIPEDGKDPYSLLLGGPLYLPNYVFCCLISFIGVF